MARLSGQKRNQKRIANNAAKKQANIEKEIARIKGGGRTPFSTDAAALANLNEKLKKVKGTTTKKSNLKVIKGTPGSSKGAMAAKAMAKKRIAEGKSTLGEFTGPDRGKKAAQAAAKKRIAEKKKKAKNKKEIDDLGKNFTTM